MKTYVCYFLILFYSFNSYSYSVPSRFENLDASLKRSRKVDSIDLKDWNINYTNSYLVLENFIYTKKASNYSPLIFSFEKAIIDYLYFQSSKDLISYAVRLEKVAIAYTSTSSSDEEKRDPIIEFDRISLPIKNIINELFVDRIELILRNSEPSSESLPILIKDFLLKKIPILPGNKKKSNYAKFFGNAEVLNGLITFSGKGHPLANPPILDLDLKAKNISLKKISKYLQPGNIDFEYGTVDVNLNFVTKNERLNGQIFIKSSNAEVQKHWNANKSFVTNIKEALVDMGIEIFDRTEDDIIKGKARFSGRVDSIDWNFWVVFRSLIKHALGFDLSYNQNKFNLPKK